MQDYETYLLVKLTKEKAESLGIKLSWKMHGWMLESNKRLTKGETVKELIMYLNGFEDGLSQKKETYLEKHIYSGIKIGDSVKIFRKAKDYEDSWGDSWIPEMDNYLGNVGVVEEDCDEEGFSVMFSNGLRFLFPYFVLQKVDL